MRYVAASGGGFTYRLRHTRLSSRTSTAPVPFINFMLGVCCSPLCSVEAWPLFGFYAMELGARFAVNDTAFLSFVVCFRLFFAGALYLCEFFFTLT